ncbi:cyanophycinase [Pedobacter sp. SYSU D00535]|uniref:cyanophycinase n=1 Tax=Pedobacter sp. SYSU D00535 TaxID=2810308 RepID=UPI001A960BD2|nr:cyanophycinase [Pedobacter sp. SYSU D00535]
MEVNPVNECPVPKGILLAIGGHENKGEAPEKKQQKENPNRLEVLRVFTELISDERSVLEVITSGSSMGAESFEDYRKVFNELGIENIGHIHHDKRKDVGADETLLERVRKASAIFISGGDQLKLTSIYGGTDFLFELKQRYIKDPIVIAGTSAGAMALSTPMIYAGNEEVQEMAGEIKVTTGLEFLKDVCIDTHFVDRNRFVRMAQVVVTNPTCIGVGISEDTAMIIRNGRDVEITGSGIVVVMDGSNVLDSSILDLSGEEPFGVQNLKVHLLTRRDRYCIVQNNPPHI